MQSPSGILSPLIGPLGPYYVRKKKNGDLIVVPRARTDAKTQGQLEYRRRFTLVTKLLSKLYLPMIKPYTWRSTWRVHPFAQATDLSLTDYFERQGLPLLRLLPVEGLDFPWVMFRSTGIGSTMYIEWDTSPSNPYYGWEHVRVWVVSLMPSFKMYCSAAIPFAVGRVPFATVEYPPEYRWIEYSVAAYRYRGGDLWDCGTPLTNIVQQHGKW